MAARRASEIFQLLQKRGVSSKTTFLRHYGPSPSDIKPAAPKLASPNEMKSSAERGKWSEAARLRVKERNLVQKAEGHLHRLQQWRLDNPDISFEMFSQNAKRNRKRENEGRISKLLKGSLCRKLNRWVPSPGCAPRYRLSILGKSFVLNPFNIGTLWGDPTHVFVSLSLSFDTPHPHRMGTSDDPRFEWVGVRTFGINPTTHKPFDDWIEASPSVLEKIVGIAEDLKDEESFRALCAEGLKQNLAGERWGD